MNWKNINLRRLRQEIISPTRKFSQEILFSIHYFINIFLSKKGKKKIPYLIYDVRNNPITFDFVFIVYYAYLFFSKQGIKAFKLIIYEPKEYKYDMPMLPSYAKHVSKLELKKRVSEMILPIAESFNCINSVEWISSNKEFKNLDVDSKYIFPRFFNPKIYSPTAQDYKKIFIELLKNKNKNAYPFLQSNFSREETIAKLPSKDKFIKFATITLRDYGFNNKRNTSSKEIKIAFNYAKSNGLKLVLVPDNIKNLDNYDIPKKVIIFSKARESLKERVSLYTYSEINFFVPSGPANISLFTLFSKTIILKFGYPNSIDSSIKYYKKTYNINYGQQPYEGLGGYVDWYTSKYAKPNYEIRIPDNFF